MYQKILVALENSEPDQSLLPHVTQLAKLLKSRLLLVHVADGWVARNYDQLNLAESEEMKNDVVYLERTAERLRAEGLEISTRLALGNPPTEILKTAATEGCDLIAMTSHGHRLLGDIIHGSTIEAVRHKANIPILVVKAAQK
ncbi:MAG: universal stress protein [Verrucomicrobia bacterium]|nr:universal stress protein [Verrucomicrobiota bacterium]